MPTVISQSRAKDWRKCHKLHDYKWNQRLRTKLPSRPLLIGQVVHAMLDAYAVGGKPKKILAEYEKKVKPFLHEDPETYQDVIPTIKGVYENYLSHYEDDGITYEESELELTMDLGDDILLKIHIDKVVSDKQKRIWIMDHKCHKKIPTADARAFDLQLVIYPTVWDTRFPKRKATGIVWDYLRTKLPTVPEQLKNGELSKRQNIDTTYEVYKAEIERLGLDITNYADMLEMLKQKSTDFFERVWLPLSNNDMVKTIMSDLKATALEIKDHGTELTDRNLSTFHCSMCQFKDLCLAELKGLDSNYVRKSRYLVEESDAEEEIDD